MARSPIDRVFDAVVPRAVDAVDPDELISRVDVDALIDRMDVDALITRVDVQALIDRVDIDALVTRVDVQALIDRVDIDALVTRVDVQAVIDRVDIDALVARVDLEALVGRLDVDALVARIDLDALVGRLDVDALVARIDLDALLQDVDVAGLAARAGIDQIVADATTGLATRVLYVARRQVLVVDRVALRVVDRVVRRAPEEEGDDALPALDGSQAAGPLARTLGFLVDSIVVSVLFSAGVSLGGSLLELFTGHAFDTADDGGFGWVLAFLGAWLLYLWVGIGVVGRTVGKGLLGLRVVAVDGSAVGGRRAGIRAVVFPFSFVLGLGFVPAVLGRHRRALHDHAAGTAEVIDWGGVALPVLESPWLTDPTSADPRSDTPPEAA